MSNLLAQYANNITAQASQVGGAQQMVASTHAQASQNTAQALTGLKQTLQAQEQTKLQAQQIQAQREAAALQADGQNSFMRMLAAKDSGASDAQAMAMENARQEKLRKDLQASANIPQTGLEITAAATAVAGKKVGDFGKWAWGQTFGKQGQERRANKNLVKGYAKDLGLDSKSTKLLLNEYKEQNKQGLGGQFIGGLYDGVQKQKNAVGLTPQPIAQSNLTK